MIGELDLDFWPCQRSSFSFALVSIIPSRFDKARAASFCRPDNIMSSDMFQELTAPNGRKYTQPIGLFINNEWLKSSDGGTIASVNPT